MTKTMKAYVDQSQSSDPHHKALIRLLMWFNRDGSPCDGFRLREEVANARRVCGLAKDGRAIGSRKKCRRESR